MTYNIYSMGNSCCPAIQNSEELKKIDLFDQINAIPDARLFSETKSDPKEKEKLENCQENIAQPSSSHLLPQEFLNCLGVIKMETQGMDKDEILGNAFLIDSGVVVTSYSKAFEEKFLENQQKKKLKFLNFQDHEQYELSEPNYNEHLIHQKIQQNRLVTCVFKLEKKKPARFMRCPLSYDFPDFIQDFSCATIIQNQQGQSRLQLKKIQKFIHFSDNTVQFQSSEPVEDGSPLVVFLGKRWYVVGIKCGDLNLKKNYKFGRTFSKKWADSIVRTRLLVPDIKNITIYHLKDAENIKDMNETLQKQFLLIQNGLGLKIKEQTHQELHNNYLERLGFLNVQPNGNYITVNGIMLEIENDDSRPEKTIGQLSQNYQKATKKPLILQNKKFSIPKTVPVSLFFEQKTEQTSLENLLNVLNDPNQFDKKVSQVYIYKLSRKIRRFQLRQKSKGPQVQITIKKKMLWVDQLFYPIAQKLTIQHIVDDLKKLFHYSFQKYHVSTNVQKMTTNLNQTIIQGKISQITFVFDDMQRGLSANTSFHVYDRQKHYKQTLSSISHRSCPSKNILSYDELLKQLVYEKTSPRFYEVSASTYFTLTYSYDHQQFSLDCTEDTLIKKSDHRWIMAKDLKIRDRILGITENQLEKLKEFTITKVQRKENSNEKEFYCTEIENTHTMVANNIIVHNEDEISIIVLEHLKEIHNFNRTKVNPNERIKVRYGAYDVFLSGFKLNKELTYKDYNIQQLMFLQIAKHNLQSFYRKTTAELAIIKRGGPKGLLSRYSKSQMETLQKQYFAFCSSQVKNINSQSLSKIENNGLSSLIVEKKACLYRFLYYSLDAKKQYKYPKIIFQKYAKQYKNQSTFLNSLKKYGHRMSKDDLLIIYLYTDEIYRKLNYYLRQNFSSNVDQSEVELLNISLALSRALRRIPPIGSMILVYRGVKVVQGKKTQYEKIGDKIILFKSFTSTTTKIHKMQYFKGEKGYLFQIQTYSGRNISNYSKYDQSQVLIPAFTYFQILSDDKENRKMRLKEIVLPQVTSFRIIFLLDTSFDYLLKMENFNAKKAELPIIVDSLSNFKHIYEHFLWPYSLMGKQILIVAGVDQVDEKNVSSPFQIMEIIKHKYHLPKSKIIIHPIGQYKKLDKIRQQMSMEDEMNWQIIQNNKQFLKIFTK